MKRRYRIGPGGAQPSLIAANPPMAAMGGRGATRAKGFCGRLRHLSPCLIAAAASLLLTTAQAPAQTNGTAVASGGQLPHALLRDPFWPTGWQPTYFGQIDTGKANGGVPTRWEEAEKLLHLTGLSRSTNGKFIGIVKGIGVVQEGDVLSVNLGGLTYKWTIRSISSKGLVLDKVAAQPMR